MTGSGSHGVGLYVNPYVTDTTIRRVSISGAGSAAIYLDEGSRRAHITDDVLVGNGFLE